MSTPTHRRRTLATAVAALLAALICICAGIGVGFLIDDDHPASEDRRPITSNADDYNAVLAVIYTSTAALSAGDIAAFREQQCPAAQTDLDTAGVQEYLQRYKGVYISNLDNIVINGTGATAMVRYRYDTSINPTAEAITEPTPLTLIKRNAQWSQC